MSVYTIYLCTRQLRDNSASRQVSLVSYPKMLPFPSHLLPKAYCRSSVVSGVGLRCGLGGLGGAARSVLGWGLERAMEKQAWCWSESVTIGALLLFWGLRKPVALVADRASRIIVSRTSYYCCIYIITEPSFNPLCATLLGLTSSSSSPVGKQNTSGRRMKPMSHVMNSKIHPKAHSPPKGMTPPKTAKP